MIHFFWGVWWHFRDTRVFGACYVHMTFCLVVLAVFAMVWLEQSNTVLLYSSEQQGETNAYGLQEKLGKPAFYELPVGPLHDRSFDLRTHPCKGQLSKVIWSILVVDYEGILRTKTKWSLLVGHTGDKKRSVLTFRENGGLEQQMYLHSLKVS